MSPSACCWSDLPDDLIGCVLRRLPSFADHARLRLVCRRWRSAWRAQRHPAVPWHPNPGYCVSLDAADTCARVPLPADARGASCAGGIGSWLVLVPAPPQSSPAAPADHLPPTAAATASAAPFLINAFSLDRVSLPVWAHDGAIFKVVLSSAPDSRDACVVAAVADSGSRRTVAVCQPAQTPSAWTSVTVAFDVEDIAFHNGELYMLDASELLHRVAVREPGGLCVEHCRVEPPRPLNVKINAEGKYLVELDGALLMVRRYLFRRYRHTVVGELSSVFALRHDGGGARRWWAPGVRLNGRFLVVGNACCGAFRARGDGDGVAVDYRQVCFVDDGRLNWSTALSLASD